MNILTIFNKELLFFHGTERKHRSRKSFELLQGAK